MVCGALRLPYIRRLANTARSSNCDRSKFADFDDTMIEYARVINANREVWKIRSGRRGDLGTKSSRGLGACARDW